MQCATCREELPDVTPICPRCGPGLHREAAPNPAPAPPWVSTAAPPWATAATPEVSHPAGEGSASAPPAAPALSALVPVAEAAAAAAVALVPPEPPVRLTKQERKARARARARELASSPRVTALMDDAPRRTPSQAEAILDAITSPHTKGVPDDEGPAPARFERPGSLTGLALLDLVLGLGSLALAAALVTGNLPPVFHGLYGAGLFGLVVFGGACVVAAIGLLALQPIGRQLQIALCLAALFFGGFSIASAVLIFAYVVRPGVGLLLSGRSPASMTAGERTRVRAQGDGSVLVSMAALIQFLSLLFLSFAAA